MSIGEPIGSAPGAPIGDAGAPIGSAPGAAIGAAGAPKKSAPGASMGAGGAAVAAAGGGSVRKRRAGGGMALAKFEWPEANPVAPEIEDVAGRFACGESVDEIADSLDWHPARVERALRDALVAGWP